MDTVILKSKYGSTAFRRRTMMTHPDSKKSYYDMVNYEFTPDNDFRVAVPKQVWDELRDLPFDAKLGIKYHEAFQTL